LTVGRNSNQAELLQRWLVAKIEEKEPVALSKRLALFFRGTDFA
jgi:hypothetical protein